MAKTVHKTFVSKAKDGYDFVLSDATVDRYGDIIMTDGWELKNFKKNPVALFNHSSNFPIGTWENIRVSDGALRGTLKLAPEGTSERIDEIRKLVDADVLRAVSVGFSPIEYKEYKSEQGYGYIYEKCELVETSLVSIPANPNALMVAKALKISAETQEMVFGKNADKKTGLVKRGTHGKHADSSHVRNTKMSGPIAQRILDGEQRIVKLRDDLNEHMKTVDDENPTDEQTAVTEELSAKIDAQEKSVASLRKAEAKLAVRAADHREETQQVRSESSESSVLEVNGRRPFAIPAKKLRPSDYIWRALTVQIKHHHEKGRRTMVDVLKSTYGECEGTHALMNIVTRAATAPALTTTQGWAADLVTVAIGDFFGLLIPTSIYAQLSQYGGRFTFGPNGILSMPTRQSTPTIGGAFVGQGAPIPVKQGAFNAVTMVPKKVGVISTFTREIAEHSTPSIEALVRDAILEDTSVAIDAVLMDSNAATAIRPAGLGLGLSSTALTSGTDLAAVIGDIKAMTNALFAGTNGNVRQPVWIMSPQIANNAALATIAATGILPFRDEISSGKLGGYPIIKSTSTAPARTWWLLDAADFVTATGDSPRFDVSDQAVLHFDDTTPLDINTTAVAATTKSLWQTDSLGVRMIMDMNWIMRRAGMVYFQQNLNWSP